MALRMFAIVSAVLGCALGLVAVIWPNAMLMLAFSLGYVAAFVIAVAFVGAPIAIIALAVLDVRRAWFAARRPFVDAELVDASHPARSGREPRVGLPKAIALRSHP